MVSTWGDLLDQMVNKHINGKIEENFGREVETEQGDGDKKCEEGLVRVLAHSTF